MVEVLELGVERIPETAEREGSEIRVGEGGNEADSHESNAKRECYCGKAGGNEEIPQDSREGLLMKRFLKTVEKDYSETLNTLNMLNKEFRRVIYMILE